MRNACRMLIVIIVGTFVHAICHPWVCSALIVSSLLQANVAIAWSRQTLPTNSVSPANQARKVSSSNYITAERIVAPAESAEPTTRLPAAKPWTPGPARANRIPPRAGRCLRVKRPLPIPTSARALEEIIIEGGMHTAADTTRSRETTARYKGRTERIVRAQPRRVQVIMADVEGRASVTRHPEAPSAWGPVDLELVFEIGRGEVARRYRPARRRGEGVVEGVRASRLWETRLRYGLVPAGSHTAPVVGVFLHGSVVGAPGILVALLL